MSMKIMSKADLLEAIDDHIKSYNSVRNISNNNERIEVLDNLNDQLMDYITVGRNEFSMSNEEIGEIIKRVNSIQGEDFKESSHVR